MTKLTIAASVALLTVGCSSTLVNRSQYDRDINAQKEYISTLERRNSDLEAKLVALDRIEDQQLIAHTQDELYDKIADQLKTALEALRHDGEAPMTFDPKRGAWTLGTDLLCDSGSWTVSVKGQEILKKFADAHRDKNLRFRVVGHTDRAPIVKPKTTQALDTDTNVELSARRAVAVMGALKKFGLAESQFECVGLGNSQPAAPNDRNPINMKKNRRVEIFVLK